MKKRTIGHYGTGSILLASLFHLMTTSIYPAESVLWGKNGENWNAGSRLPDFSWAGYRHGEKSIPNLPPGKSVKDFGAKGDGQTDDTEAFLEALSQVNGAIEIPEGRYVITKILEISRPGVVLRGVDPEKSILVCPIPLNEIKESWGATTGGQKTSNYSWSGGIVWIKGKLSQKKLSPITKEAVRGSYVIEADSVENLKPGQRIQIYLEDNQENTLANHLYTEDPGETEKLLGKTRARLTCRIVSLSGNTVEIDRPLRFDIKSEWNREIRSFDPEVTESGVENLGFEFPDKEYEGHFTELGHNAIAIGSASDCWARNIRIHNADSGIFVSGFFCTVQDVIFTNQRKNDTKGNSGHHGVYFGGDDNLFTRFDYQTKFIHDISVSHCAGNVFSDGKGIDLCFDHHKRAPYENLFTNLDAGKGSRLWACGGGAALGKHCAARGTFWNIRAQNPLRYPSPQFAPLSINLVGLTTDQAGETDLSGKWFEVFADSTPEPQNLHLAQLRKRLSGE